MLRRDLLAAIKDLEEANAKAAGACPLCHAMMSLNVETARAKIVQAVLDAKPDLELP